MDIFLGILLGVFGIFIVFFDNVPYKSVWYKETKEWVKRDRLNNQKDK